MSIAADPAETRPPRKVLETGYAQCAATARRAASNFYLTFWLLPRDKRLATCALYAFFRRADDLVDTAAHAQERRRALSAYRESLTAALAGSGADLQLAALADTIRRFSIPHKYFFDALDGVAMDLVDASGGASGGINGRDRGEFAPSCEPMFRTIAELEHYCYRVASVVGLACIHVWGFRDPAALPFAVQCGYAFQWTNILRDVGADRRQGRIYLPAEVLCEHRSTSDELGRLAQAPIDARPGCESGQLDQLHLLAEARRRAANMLRSEASRARAYYAAAEPLLPLLSTDGRRIFTAMFTTYRELLGRVEHASTDVFARRVRVPTWRKLQIAARSLVGGRTRRGRGDLAGPHFPPSELSGR
jgi:phytoene synthase